MKKLESIQNRIKENKNISMYEIIWSAFDDILDELLKMDGEPFIRSAAVLVETINVAGSHLMDWNPEIRNANDS